MTGAPGPEPTPRTVVCIPIRLDGETPRTVVCAGCGVRATAGRDLRGLGGGVVACDRCVTGALARLDDERRAAKLP